MSKTRTLLALLVAMTLVLFTLGSVVAQEGQLTIYHWWTAGGERQAIDDLFRTFNEKYPDVEIVDNPIAGGGGITLKTVLMGLLAAGMPPDTFQSLSGAELKMYVDGGYIQPVDDIWEQEGLEEAYPAVIAKMCTFEGHYYGVPMNAHRANWLFFNKPLFDELGLEPPKSVDELLAVCEAIVEAKPEVAPISIGTREKWPSVFLFDVILLGVGGPDLYENFYTGKVDVTTDADFRAAVEKFAALVPYLYPYHGAKTWSEIIAPMIEGEAGMMVIGDFALGFLAAAGYEYGVDWDAVPFPQEPEEPFLLIVDTYTLPTEAKNPDMAKLWLAHLGDPAVQQSFNIIKGSLAVHQDVPSDIYPEAVRIKGAEAFKTVRIVPSSVHGVLAPPPFLSDHQDLLTRFLYSPDVDRFIGEEALALELHNVAGASEWYWATE